MICQKVYLNISDICLIHLANSAPHYYLFAFSLAFAKFGATRTEIRFPSGGRKHKGRLRGHKQQSRPVDGNRKAGLTIFVKTTSPLLHP
jgi:hypothetical protein